MSHLIAKLALSAALLAGGALSAQAYFGSVPADHDGQAKLQLAQAGGGTGGSGSSDTSGTDGGSGSTAGSTQIPQGGKDPKPQPAPTGEPGTNNPTPSR